MEFNTIIMDLPCSVRACMVPNDDGTYTIIINSRMNTEQQAKSFLRETSHVSMEDNENGCIDVIEFRAHSA